MTDAPVAAAPDAASRGPFSVAAVAWLIGVGVLVTLALVVLGAYAPELRDGDDGQGHALSRSGTGFAGTAQLLGDTGFDVRLSRGPVSGGDEGALLILTPPAGRPMTLPGGAEQVDTTLIVLPKWNTTPLPRRSSWVETRGMLPPAMILATLPDDMADGLTVTQAPVDRDAARAPVRPPDIDLRQIAGEPLGRVRSPIGLQTIRGEGWQPVVADGAGRTVVALHSATGTYVLSDPDLLNTAGVADLPTARAADRLLHAIWYGEGPVLFDLTAWGFAAPRSVLRLALEPPLLGATLCLLAAVALTGWQAAIRFGPHRRSERAIALGKQALADNTAGLIRLGRRERAMAAPYAELIRARAARAVGLPRGLSPTETDARLARLPGSQTDYAAARARMEAARDATALAAAARDLHRWKNETTHGRR